MLVSAWQFMWPRAWIEKVRDNRVGASNQTKGQKRYYVARILQVPLGGPTSWIAYEMWGNAVVTEFHARTLYSRTHRSLIYKQLYPNE